jgi:hypothetical protein
LAVEDGGRYPEPAGAVKARPGSLAARCAEARALGVLSAPGRGGRGERLGREPISSHRFGGEGFEFGRSVAGVDKDLWIVGHTSSGREGSSVFLVRMDFTAP